MTDEESDLRALRWRCRRGMRELDQLLERWLDQRGADASDAERGEFRRLLAVEDDKLWRAFLGYERLADDDLQRLVEHVAALPR